MKTKLRNLLTIILLSVLVSSCATIINSSRQIVFFKGATENGITKVKTPDGTFEIENGTASYLMTRSKADIPIMVYCPDGKKKSGIIMTEFDWPLGGAANLIWTYGIPFAATIDVMSNKAYNIPDISLSFYCEEEVQENQSEEDDSE